MNKEQNEKGDRYSIVLIVVGIIILYGLLEVTYRILA
jgi:hypothetical protein